MGLLAKIRDWLNQRPDTVPVDLREFRESQKRLYEQSAELETRTDEFSKMVKRMTVNKRGRKKGA